MVNTRDTIHVTMTIYHAAQSKWWWNVKLFTLSRSNQQRTTAEKNFTQLAHRPSTTNLTPPTTRTGTVVPSVWALRRPVSLPGTKDSPFLLLVLNYLIGSWHNTILPFAVAIKGFHYGFANWRWHPWWCNSKAAWWTLRTGRDATSSRDSSSTTNPEIHLGFRHDDQVSGWHHRQEEVAMQPLWARLVWAQCHEGPWTCCWNCKGHQGLQRDHNSSLGSLHHFLQV